MSYDYKTEKPFVFTEDGQRMFLKIRDKCNSLQQIAGAFTIEKAVSDLGGSTWARLACIDRLVELGEFEYVNKEVLAQFHVLRKVEYYGK